MKDAIKYFEETSEESEAVGSNYGEWKDATTNLHMMVVNKKNAAKIDLTRSLDNVFFADPLFDNMEMVNFKNEEEGLNMWDKISKGIFSYLAPKYAYHKVPKIHQ